LPDSLIVTQSQQDDSATTRDDGNTAWDVFFTTYFLVLKTCTDFMWNEISGERVCEFLISAYEGVIHQKTNLFAKAGKLFIKALARLYKAFVVDSALSSIAVQ